VEHPWKHPWGNLLYVDEILATTGITLGTPLGKHFKSDMSDGVSLQLATTGIPLEHPWGNQPCDPPACDLHCGSHGRDCLPNLHDTAYVILKDSPVWWIPTISTIHKIWWYQRFCIQLWHCATSHHPSVLQCYDVDFAPYRYIPVAWRLNNDTGEYQSLRAGWVGHRLPHSSTPVIVGIPCTCIIVGCFFIN
jgi:hypothetical protein